MVRRLICTVALAATAGAYVAAVTERATFILTDGEHKSGKVVFHTESRENLINGQFNLGTDDGKEVSYPASQVAVIDFVGGRPAAAELQLLPQDTATHLLVLRNGVSQQGHLVNLIGGDTVRWRNEAGQEQQYAINDVARIYLNALSARTAFRFNGAPANAAVATSGQTLAPGAVQVNANQQWTDTGITVKKGDRVAFQGSGEITFGLSAGQTAGLDGNGAVRSPAYPVPAMPVGGLIGKVGNSAPFPIGANTQPIVMPADGRLMLGVNDNEIGDNGGFFSVVVTKH